MIINPIQGLRFPLHFIFNLKQNHIQQIYAGTLLRDFTMSLVGIFEPIYFYIFFKERTDVSAISLTGAYYAAFFFLAVFFSPLGAKLTSRIGFRWTALFSVPFRMGYYIVLILLPAYPFLLPIALFVQVIAAVLYWPGFHFLFAHVSRHDSRASSVGFMSILSYIAAAVGPACGGVILVLFGYPVLFIVVLFLFLVSVFPFWFSPDFKERYKDSLFYSLRCLFRRRTWREVAAFFASGVEDQANGIFWPLFLFLLSLSFSALGFVISASLVISLIVSYGVGRISDKVGSGKILNTGVFIHSISWISRLFVQGPNAAFTAHSLYGASRPLVMVPFSAIFYDGVADNGSESYCRIILREQALNLGRALFLASSVIVFWNIQNFAWVFIVGALSTLCMRFLQGEIKSKFKSLF